MRIKSSTRLTLMLLFVSVVIVGTAIACQAQSTAISKCSARAFLATGATGRLHFAFMACTDEAMDACNNRCADVKWDCEYRGEDGGTPYSSCRCQSIRCAKQCYEDAGCYYGSQLFLEISPECFGSQ
jgi:hypothetical protein